LAHCISGDYTLGAGVAKQMDKHYDMKRKLQDNYPNKSGRICALKVDNVFNLVTKATRYDKPTYATLKVALLDMKIQCLKGDIKKVAMPYIGCGMDGLEWKKVKLIVQDVFKGTDIEILICHL
jgi:hypothetical protein